MIELYFIYNGHRKILIGSFGHIHSAINELKQHQASYSAVNNPRFRKSMSGEISGLTTEQLTATT
nr:MAG TPA: hypothetical protein [Caudoviricetes sp.]